MAAWPAVALVGPYELLMMVIRNSQVPSSEKSEGKRVPRPVPWLHRPPNLGLSEGAVSKC